MHKLRGLSKIPNRGIVEGVAYSAKKQTTHLVIGAGEVGSALYNVLKKRYHARIRDVADEVSGRFDVLHISYTWHQGFVRNTKKYIKKYAPKLVIIHSTVPVGTTRAVSWNAIHSPIRGIHPRLEEGIMTFVKYFGGTRAKEAARIFSAIGIQTKTFTKPETTELAKILDTTYYAWNVIFAKEVKHLCDVRGLDFSEVYSIPNEDYNKGYEALGKPEVTRPVLKPTPGKIGGHCLIPNCNLLKNWLTETIKKRNRRY